MRKVVVSINVSLDGYISGSACQLDWHFNLWTREMGEEITAQLKLADIILLGKRTYEVMAGFWPSGAVNIGGTAESIEFASMMNNYPKIVFSRSLRDSNWNNSTIKRGSITGEILKLKQMDGKDMMVYGSGKLVSSLIHLDLVDEYRIWIHPVLLGEGKPLFKEPGAAMNLRLLKTHQFANGVVVLSYQRLKQSG